MIRAQIFAVLIAAIVALSAVQSLRVAAMAGSVTRAAENRRLPNERLLRGVLTIYVWKMTEAVKLNEEQSARVFPLVRKNFQTRWQLAMKRRHLLELFRRAVAAAPQPESELRNLLTRWEENEKELHSAREELRKELTSVLTPEQQAKSLLFEEEFEGELSRVLTQIRRENSQRVIGQSRDREQ